jgi:NAD(P)-dependent dehydrogenase (short-subunit alcohol dehydrogenase family)
MTDPTRLDGEVAIVTGAAQGIGRGIANVLAEAGAKIVIGDLQDASHTAKEIRDSGGEAVTTVMDTSSAEDDRALVELALREYGRLDILVNNAAIDGPVGNAWDLPAAEWERTIAVNLSGVFYCSQAAIPTMTEAGKGCIINISSIAARRARLGGSPAYNASKAGVLGLTLSFSSHLADRGIRVNAILPGSIESRDFGWNTEQRALREKVVPMGRLGAPRDIGGVIRYLASPAAEWVSGSLIEINGGGWRSVVDIETLDRGGDPVNN